MTEENKREGRFEVPEFLFSAAELLLVSISGCSSQREEDKPQPR